MIRAEYMKGASCDEVVYPPNQEHSGYKDDIETFCSTCDHMLMQIAMIERQTILDIMRSYPSAEIFYTFMISSLLAFLQKNEPQQLRQTA